MMAGKKQRGQQLLGELCPEIDRLQGTHRLFDDEDDTSRSIRCEDTMHQRDHWTTCLMKLKEYRSFDL
ncbi:hypothetical protein NC651_011003 [Populus alba x Populus x berolinensis]|nr:hypothetical protein NC651_011003 [Populus alba x Populus x berolinensis]